MTTITDYSQKSLAQDMRHLDAAKARLKALLYIEGHVNGAVLYSMAADAILSDLSAEMTAAYDGADSDDTLANLQGLRDSLAELDPPPAMLAAHTQIAYALQSCAFGLSVEATGDTDALLLLDCQRAIKDARTEAARYAATVGGFPVTVSP